MKRQRYGYTRRAIARDVAATVLGIASGIFVALFLLGYIKP